MNFFKDSIRRLVIRGVRVLIWVEFNQTKNPNHIKYSCLSEVKQLSIIRLDRFG